MWQLSTLSLLWAALLMVSASAYPNHSRSHTRSSKALRNPLVSRRSFSASGLSARTTSSCMADAACSSASDQAGLADENACANDDTACDCSAMELLSSGCLSCILAENNMSLSDYDSTCDPTPTTTACNSQCSDAADMAADNALGNCPSAEIGNPCACAAIAQMSSACLNCLLADAGITEAQYEQACSATPSTTSFAAGGGATSTHSSTPSASSTAVANMCASQCTSTSDQAAITAGEECAGTDTACQCSAIMQLSTACLTCVLQQDDITQSELQQECAAASSTASTTTTASTSPSATAISCASQCTSASDQAGVQAGENCAATDIVCQCAASMQLSSTCLACVLQSDGITESQYQQECAATGTSSTSLGFTSATALSISTPSATPTGVSTTSAIKTTLTAPAPTVPTTAKAASSSSSSTLSSTPSATPPKSGARRWCSVDMGGVLAGALGAVILFV